MERTCTNTAAAADALGKIDLEGLLDLTADSVNGTLTCTLGASLAEVGIDLDDLELLTCVCGTSLFVDVCLVFVTEVLYRADDR